MDKWVSLRNSGSLQMPAIGLGTFSSFKSEGVEDAIITGIRLGYRLLDCAHFYNNEVAIGKALQRCFEEGVVKREEMFIVSKLWCYDNHPECVMEACRQTLKDLQLDYLDLYLMHFPLSFVKTSRDKPVWNLTDDDKLGYSEENIANCWEKLEECVRTELTKSIGISNFSITKTERLLKTAKITPAVHQIEIHPYLQQHKLKNYCDSKGIAVQAYSPLGQPGNPNHNQRVLDDPVIKEIAQKHNITLAQVCLSFGIHRGLSVIPKSSNSSRMAENLKYVRLDEEDIRRLTEIDRNLRLLPSKLIVKSDRDIDEYLWDKSEDEKYEVQ